MENSSKTSALSLQFHLLPYLLFLFFMHNLVVLVTGDSNVTPYNPVENIIIDCGSFADAPSLDGRPWIGDVNGKFIPMEQQNSNNKSLVIKAASPLPDSVDTVPYSTARVSYSEFNYSIPLTSGPKFIRLHFYPTSYQGFEDYTNKAFFSVKAGPFTLLKNFSASLHARGRVSLFKEFCINVDEGQRLNLTFTPTPDISDSYAFINGIEVVSMPTNLYYPASDDGLPFLGQGNSYPLGTSTALETMYRVNVGGTQIPLVNDTGMFRDWTTADDDYLTIAKPSALPVNLSVDLTFRPVPSFSAPRDVYVTARTMGTSKTPAIAL